MLLITTSFFCNSCCCRLTFKCQSRRNGPDLVAQWLNLQVSQQKAHVIPALMHHNTMAGQIWDTNEPFLVMTWRDVKEPFNILRCSVTDFYFGSRSHSAQHFLLCIHLDDHFVSPTCKSAAAKQMKHPQNKRVPLQASGCLLVVKLISVFYL